MVDLLPLTVEFQPVNNCGPPSSITLTPTEAQDVRLTGTYLRR